MPDNYAFSDGLQVHSFNSYMAGMPMSMAARFAASGLKCNSLRTNALLKKDEWEEIDREVLAIAKQKLVGIEDLRSRGLIQPLGGLGTLISSYQRRGTMTPANVNIDGITPGEEDGQDFDLVSVPIPIIHKDFRLNIRHLEASRRNGDGLDVTQASDAGEIVADGAENILFNGSGIVLDGNRIYGYTNHPDRNIGVAVGPWTTPANAYNTVLQMVADARNNANSYGPFVLYVSANQWVNLFLYYTDGSKDTPYDRIKKIPEISDIKLAVKLADDTAVLVEMSRRTVDIAIAQDLVTIEWESSGGMVSHFKVMMVLAPRLKSDKDQHMGLVHYTGLGGQGSGS